MAARKPAAGDAEKPSGDAEQAADGQEAPGTDEGAAERDEAAQDAGEAPEMAYFQAPGHVIGFTLPLDAVIQGQVDSGFLTPADPPE